MTFFNRNKYLIAVLLGLALGIAMMTGGLLAYNFFYPSNSATADVESSNSSNTGNSSVASLLPDISGIVEKVGDAVVFVEATIQMQSQTTNPFFNDPFFRYFFGDSFNFDNNPRTTKGYGSGFIINEDGYILTNQHVIDGAIEVNVKVNGFDTPFKATIVGKDFDLDLAVLKINSDKKLPYIKLGDSDNMRVGEWVIAIGNPYSLDHTVTVGVVSAKGRQVTIPDTSSGKTRVYKNLMQTDAAINPGNSGGPLISLAGEVIGINTAVNAEAQGIGFAIPINTAKEVLNDLIENGSVTRPYIGVGLQDLTKDLANYFNLKSQEGALISYVYPGSPAEKAGLTPGDIILKIGDKTIKNSNDVTEIVSKQKIGNKLVMLVFRNGMTQYITVEIGKKPDQ